MPESKINLNEQQSEPVVFKCFVHNWTCATPEEWEQHMREAEHEHEGVAPCNQCGTETKFKWKGKVTSHTVPALCKSCKEKLLAELQP